MVDHQVDVIKRYAGKSEDKHVVRAIGYVPSKYCVVCNASS